MAKATIEKLGDTLAIRFPNEFARTSGLRDGEHVELKIRDGGILISRSGAATRGRASAEGAAAEIIRESRRHSLGEISMRDLLDHGRRG